MLFGLDRSRERRLLRAGLLYRSGRGRVVWRNGVVYFGGSLFLLLNAVDYMAEPRATLTPTSIFWLAAALFGCILLGYGYGVLNWRNLDRLFGQDSG